MPLDEAKKMNMDGDTAEFLQLLEGADCKGCEGGGESQSGCDADGGISDGVLQNTMRKEMIHLYNKNSEGGTESWVEIHVDFLSVEARRECSTIVNG